ncbi:MAG: hypothetical protein AMXMBFR7_19260 [Planctomycetota bacterium]
MARWTGPANAEELYGVTLPALIRALTPERLHCDRTRRGRRLTHPPARWSSPPKGFPPAHRHESFEFCYALHGRCPFLLGDERILLRAGDLALLAPRVFHREHAAERAGPYVLLWSACHPGWMGANTIEHLGGGRFRTGSFRQGLERFPEGHRVAEALDLELYEARPGAFLRAQGMLLSLCGAALKHLAAQSKSAAAARRPDDLQERRVKLAVNYVRDRFAEPLDLAAVAAHVGIGPGYLSALFTRELGRTFTDFLAACRLEEAERLLRDPALSIKEIAHRVGLDNPFYFTRLFKKRTGRSPKAWRTEHGL